MSQLDEGSSYLTGILPPIIVFGAGLTLVVAPVTATVLAAADSRHSGIASGVNNAVARVGGLLAVAVVPVAAGLAGASYTDVDQFAAGFERAMLICAGLLLVGAALAAVMLRERTPAPPPVETDRIDVAKCVHCGVTGPQLHPRATAVQRTS